MRDRNLQPADRAMGSGPFRVRFDGLQAQLAGSGVISGIREIWVRNVYLGSGLLSIPPDATVVDLGANVGNFTALALAHGPAVRVVSVEMSSACCEKISRLLTLNGWDTRATICRSVIGGMTSFQHQLMQTDEAASARRIGVSDFLREQRLTRIDFLKCDIEGSEFELFAPSSPLLAITRQIAMEVHDSAGDRNRLLETLRAEGFEAVVYRSSKGDCIVHARRQGSEPVLRSAGSVHSTKTA